MKDVVVTLALLVPLWLAAWWLAGWRGLVVMLLCAVATECILTGAGLIARAMRIRRRIVTGMERGRRQR